jgi:RNA polymerase sigma factor (sigma-70 family)
LADFRELNDSELQRLDDDQLVEYAIAARAAGAADAERRAFEILAYGLMPFIQAKVAKVPDQDLEDVALDALAAALKSLHRSGAMFRGSSLAEFRAWLKQIAHAQVVEYYRAKERRVDTEPLPSEHERDEEVFGKEPYEGDFTDGVVAQDVVDRLLDDLDPPKRRVVELKVFERRTAAETKEIVNQEFPGLNAEMTSVNADQIASRFRKELREKLDEG